MNPFSQIGRQLLGIWKQLGLNQRITVGASALVVFVALFSVVFWSSRVDYALLYGKLDDSEGAKVVSYLDEAKIQHKIGQGGGAIYVPRDKVHFVRMQLASRRILAARAWDSKFLTSQTSAFPILCSARTIFAPSRATFTHDQPAR